VKVERVFHPYDKWEEMQHNMWGACVDRKKLKAAAILFTSNHKLYGRFMMRVIREWPISCENALTDDSINKRAWIGHAAVALAHEIPEDITRDAWKELTHEQQFLANKEADAAIQAWEYSYVKSKKLCRSVGEPMLFGWDS